MWDADSLLADPTVSDYLGKEPTISASDQEDFGKKVSGATLHQPLSFIISSWSNVCRRVEIVDLFGP